MVQQKQNQGMQRLRVVHYVIHKPFSLSSLNYLGKSWDRIFAPGRLCQGGTAWAFTCGGRKRIEQRSASSLCVLSGSIHGVCVCVCVCVSCLVASFGSLAPFGKGNYESKLHRGTLWISRGTFHRSPFLCADHLLIVCAILSVRLEILRAGGSRSGSSQPYPTL